MRFTQVGNGSALNPLKTNSSFLFEGTKCSMLVDCGTNVYQELIRKRYNLDKLRYIFITHMDDDHIGSLRSLMYELFFKHKTVPCVIVDSSLKDLMLDYLNPHHGLVKDGKKDNTELFEFIELTAGCYYSIDLDDEKNIMIKSFKNYHYQPGSGITVQNFASNKAVSITGDSIPCQDILDEYNMNKRTCSWYKMYHDFSEFNMPSIQVHACRDSMNALYPEKMIKKLKFYHNDRMIKPKTFMF